jgi:apolipoprotein N-acyltransferase
MAKIQPFPARCLLAILCGGAYAFAYPPFGWRWLVFPALAGLLILLKGQHGTRARTLGFLFGMASFGVSLSWLYHIFGVLVVVLMCVLAAFPALFSEMQSRATRYGMRGVQFAIFTACNWGAWEFIRAELFPLRFPWMTPGLALGPTWLTPWVGVYGAGFVILLALALAIHGHWRIAIVPVLVTWIPLSPLPALVRGDSGTHTVAGLQFENVSLDVFLNETRKLPAEIDHVVWPEYAVPYDIRNNLRDWRLLRSLVGERNITLTFGTQLHAGTGTKWRNTALTLDPDGIRGEHTKVHTVHFFNDGTPGTTAVPVKTKHGMIGTPICFDCDYEDVVRRMTRAGAEMFVVPIMDAASWSARQHDQHAELFRMRASENGRWMFVCGSSGTSQIIDPHGHVHAKLPALAEGVMVGQIAAIRNQTFYTRAGWLLPWINLTTCAVWWTFLVFAKPRKHADRSIRGP